MKENKGRKDNPEAFDCEHCLNWEWFGDEDGYQCRRRVTCAIRAGSIAHAHSLQWQEPSLNNG